MKILLAAGMIAFGFFVALCLGDLNAEVTPQNILSGICGGLIASAGLTWGLR